MNKFPRTIWRSGSLAVLLLAAFGLLVLFPLVQYFATGLITGDADGLATTRTILGDHRLQQAFLHTLAVALLACGLASFIAVPAAFLAVRMSRPVRILIQVLGFLPLTMPPFVSAAVLGHFAETLSQIGIAQPFAGLDVAGSNIGLILVFALHFLPFILFSLIAGLRHTDRSLGESARNLGAGRLRTWYRVTLPLATPAYGLGAGLMILRIFEDIGTPVLLGVEGMLAPQILSRLGSSGLSDPWLNANAMVLMVASVLVTLVAWSALAQRPGVRGAGPCARPLRWRNRSGSLLISLPLILALGTLALAPHVWLVLMALGVDWPVQVVPQVFDPAGLLHALAEPLGELELTLGYIAGAGLLTALLAAACGSLTWQAGALGRMARFLTTSLFAIPGVVLALAYSYTWERLDQPQTDWPGFAWLTLVLVIAIKQVPLAERIMAARLTVLHQGASESARNLGASRLDVGLHIGLPALATVLATAFLIGSAAALVELSVALLLIQGQQAPLALQLFQSLRLGTGNADGPAQGLLLAGLAAAVLLLLFLFLRQYCYRPETGPPAVTRNPA